MRRRRRKLSRASRFSTDQWVKYDGPRGGTGWQHSGNPSDVRYQDNKPSESESSKHAESNGHHRSDDEEWGRKRYKARPEYKGYHPVLAKRLQIAEDRISPINDYETCMVYDDDGQFRFSKKGEKSKIVFTSDEMRRFKDGIFTHNHPSGFGLSPMDVRMAILSDMKEVRAVGVTKYGKKYLYVLRRPKDGWGFGEMPDLTDELMEAWKSEDDDATPDAKRRIRRVTKAINKLDSSVKDRFWDKIKKGEMTTDVADVEHWHQVFEALSLMWDKVQVPTEPKVLPFYRRYEIGTEL